MLLAHWTAPDVREFLFDGEVLSQPAISAVIEDSERDFAAAGYGLWLAFEKETSRLAGTAGLRPLEDLGIEILYSLAAEARGKGYATEAGGAVIEYALEVLELPRCSPRSTRETARRPRSSPGSACGRSTWCLACSDP